MFTKNLEITFLLDFYGEVLSSRTREMLEMYYCDDLSLSEGKGSVLEGLKLDTDIQPRHHLSASC